MLIYERNGEDKDRVAEPWREQDALQHVMSVSEKIKSPLRESGTRPTLYLVVMHIHIATPTLRWERELDKQTTPVCEQIMSNG
jgi:hypothetical protein